jgi:hypothetical protein
MGPLVDGAMASPIVEFPTSASSWSTCPQCEASYFRRLSSGGSRHMTIGFATQIVLHQ